MAIPKPEPSDWLRANAQELQVTDQEVLRLLRDAKKRVDALLQEIEDTGKNQIRRAQLEHSRAKLLAQQSDVFQRLGDLVSSRRASAAARAQRLSAAADAALLSLVGKGRQAQFLYDSALQVSQRAIDAALARMRLSQLPLSRRIYNTGVWMNGRLGRLINETLASGLNAKEFAKRARDWFNPNTPGGVRYAAMRLARTEINNAFHAMSAEKYADTPWVTRVDWNLSKSHPKPDICNTLAAESPFDKDLVPARPHPQCMCYITAQQVSEDDFVENFLKGDYDAFLDAELEKNGWDVKADAPAKPSKVQQPTPAPKPNPTLSGDAALRSVPKGLPKRGSLTPKQRKSLKTYEGAFFAIINGFLRNGLQGDANDRIDSATRRDIAAIDSVMDASRLPNPVEAWRGMNRAERLFGDRLNHDLTGFTWTEKAYSSTSTEEKIAKQFLVQGMHAPAGDVMIRVFIPAGAKAVWISDSHNGNQAEILLHRGADWRVSKDHGIDSSGIRRLDVEVIPHG